MAQLNPSLLVICHQSTNWVADYKYDFKNRQYFLCKRSCSFFCSKSLPLGFWSFWIFKKNKVVSSWEMLYEDKEDDDDKMEKQPIDDPNVNEFDSWCLRQFWSYRVVEGVHNQHCGDRNGNACLEMLFAEEQGGLKQKVMNEGVKWNWTYIF